MAAAALAAALLPAGAAQALTLQQEQNISVSGSDIQTLTWNQFNTLGGTRVLTGITFRASGRLGGSFTVTNNAGTSAKVSDSQTRMRLTFLGVGGPGQIQTSLLDPLVTAPVSNSTGTDIVAGGTQTFTVSQSPAQSLNLADQDLFTFASYFTGTGTVNSEVSNRFLVSVTGNNFNLNSTALTLIGNTTSSQGATLIYTYTEVPAAAVPGPLAVAGAGVAFGWSRKLRRRSGSGRYGWGSSHRGHRG